MLDAFCERLVFKRKGLEGGLFCRFKVRFEDQQRGNFVHLFFALFVRQFRLTKQSIGECGCVTFVDKANRAVGYMIQPGREIPGFNRFLAFAAITMDRQSHNPAQNLILPGQILKVLLVQYRVFSRVRF